MQDYVIDVAKQFSARPYGRHLIDGDHNGEAFRKELLADAIKSHPHVTVDLSGSYYYGAAFLEEAFGGLVRDNFSKDELDRKLEIVHRTLPSIAAQARLYIQEAAAR
ncbi:MAG: STAS-like domain-containing protein [bacterium]